MFKLYNFIILLFILYSCSPVNKQHGYLLDDFLVSSEKISKFEETLQKDGLNNTRFRIVNRENYKDRHEIIEVVI